MRRIRPHVAVALIYLMTPAAVEITENVVHLALNGHTAHAIPDAAHQPDDPEHGCSGPWHVCPCHSSAIFTVARPAHVGSPLRAVIDLRPANESLLHDGHLDDVFRPPIV